MIKFFRRLLSSALAFLLVCGNLLACAAGTDSSAAPLTILFTHDTHDHFYPDAADQGGYVRLASLLKERRSQAKGPVLTVDGGDFSMGSLFQTIYTTDAPELRAMGLMKYDAVTLGNHEFDYRLEGMTQMLNSAVVKGQAAGLPQIVQANYKPPKEAKEAWAAWNQYGITDYVVLEREGTDGSKVKAAVFGLMGEDADACAPMSGIQAEPIVEAAKRVVKEIQEKETVDYIICLSHSGTNEKGKGEDYELARKVKGIDVIVSGHTHSIIPEPIRVKNTLIVSAGEYARNLGELVIAKGEDGALELKSYTLYPVNGAISDDPEMAALTASFQTQVEKSFLSRYGLGYHQELSKVTGRDFTIPETGDLIGRAYISAIQKAEGEAYVPVDFAVAPDGVIRDSLRTGPVTTSEAFDILSLGFGGDGTPTYPLISVYLTGADLKNAFEVDASISGVMPAAALYGAGMEWSYNPRRMLLDRVTDSAQVLEGGRTVDIQDDQLYRVAADLYSGQMLGAVESQSFGLLTVTPRDENGEPITDLESRILHNPDGSELKAWYALATYLKGQEELQPTKSCKTVNPSLNPIALIKHPGLPTLLVLAVIVIVAALVGFGIRRLFRRKNARKSVYRRYRGR